MKTGSGDFSIGSMVWPGIGKLLEEAGEVSQVCGKLIGSHGSRNYWDGTDLKSCLQDELADLMAAIEFVVAQNDLNTNTIERRCTKKLELFDRWHEES